MEVVQTVSDLKELLKSLKKGKKYVEFFQLKDHVDFHKVKKNILVVPNGRVVFTPGIDRASVSAAYSGCWVSRIKTPEGKSVRVTILDSSYSGNYWLSLKQALIVKRDNLKMINGCLDSDGIDSVFCTNHWYTKDSRRLATDVMTLLPNGTNKSEKVYRVSTYNKRSVIDDWLVDQVFKYNQDVIDMIDMSISILDLGPMNFTSLEEWEAGAPIINLK